MENFKMPAFVPGIDISEYTNFEGEFTVSGAKKMREDTDAYFVARDDDKENDDQEHNRIRQNIDLMLSEHCIEKYESIAETIKTASFQRLSKFYEDFKVFETSMTIFEIEKTAGVYPSVYDICSSIDEYVGLKNITLYFFRRIMMCCPKTDIAAAFDEVLGKNPSIFFLIKMLDSITIIGDKGYVGLVIADLYANLEMIKEALYLMEFTKKQYTSFEPTVRYLQNEYNPDLKHEIKIAFITCVNDKRAYEECLYYINRLAIPRKCFLDTVSVYDANSMAAGYNAAMESSDADIKVYLHQDVCILNPYFIYEVIRIFEIDSSIGLIGMVGSPKLPPDAMMWHGYRNGNLYKPKYTLQYGGNNHSGSLEINYVEAIDGLLMVTNRDVRWREDLFDGWHFYDISQSKEFTNRGISVVVPEQPSPWVVHDDGLLNLSNYNRYRKVFINEYLINKKHKCK